MWTPVIILGAFLTAPFVDILYQEIGMHLWSVVLAAGGIGWYCFWQTQRQVSKIQRKVAEEGSVTGYAPELRD